MTEAEIESAAHADPDAQPLTQADLATLPRIPRAKTIRRTLASPRRNAPPGPKSPLGTLRDWEQGRTEPDQPARAYLTAIAREPAIIARALTAPPSSS